ncbi:thymine dioxygenase [Mycena rosella]|uniref:Thymine dioxygenase n=1 Tax=Mycena rosella TaxID=1033263 RepID=A0AAD7GAD2_MYCRO|nr:thymine dioxygenase [Mycena rosella]
MSTPEDALKNAEISKIDFAAFLDGSDKQAVADKILASFKTTGFVYLLNHGIHPEQVAKMFKVSKDFFAQSMDVKKLAPRPPSGSHHRGYSTLGLDNTELAFGANERFDCGSEGENDMVNIWLPDGMLPGFRESCMDFFAVCHEVTLNVLKALALGLGLDENYFDQYHTAKDNTMPLLYYPRWNLAHFVAQGECPGRMPAHSDFGSVTLLFQDEVAGLEVEDLAVPGSFRPVPPIPGALIVNTGDLMARWTNNMIKSTYHRVCAPPGSPNGMVPERYSIPYFCCPDFDTIVDCIPGTWDVERPKKYKPISLEPRYKLYSFFDEDPFYLAKAG